MLATANRHKVKELRALLAGLDVDIGHLGEMDDPPDIEEPHDTFAENALEKALVVARLSGHWALADDSGLMVDALGGAPGVKSARYAGEDATDEQLVAKLLSELEGVPEPRRTAHFVCALVLASPEGELGRWEGRVDGLITTRPQGENGFGYDPVFWYPPAGVTFAQMAPADKNAVSHRGRALRAFAADLPHLLRRAQGEC
ncbi:MAG: RdgB/HAM1 family non-canonical purine NTP pyrophosphatase [Armatimonadetes bacterium]|nr:RdgB/HAM1 family non-canonical purine NTP pyrophosphatase [Armatimonadota bacterium]